MPLLASRGVAVALHATLLLRASIPDGYMPSPAGSGFLFELCPSRVPAAFMQALAGSDAHRHHQADAAATAHFNAQQCPIGHLLSGAVAIDTLWSEPDASALAAPLVPAGWLPVSTRLFTWRPRGPPA